jgi:hypothetical protein
MLIPACYKVAIGGDKPALYADVSDAECYAIGKMTTSWAILEHSMMTAAIQLAEKYKPPMGKGFMTLPIVRRLANLILPTLRPAVPKNFATLPFEARFRVFRNLIKSVPTGTARARMENIASRIANVQAERHDFTHGIWDWTTTVPTKVTVDHARKKGRRRHKQYDSAAFLKFAERIAQINFDLRYPDGLKQFEEAQAQVGYSINRRFLIEITGMETDDPTLGPSNVSLRPEISEAYHRLVAEHGGTAKGARP